MQRTAAHAVVPQVRHPRVRKPGLQYHARGRHQHSSLKHQLSLGSCPQAPPLESACMRRMRGRPPLAALAEQHMRVGALKRERAHAPSKRAHTARTNGRRSLLRQHNSGAARLPCQAQHARHVRVRAPQVQQRSWQGCPKSRRKLHQPSNARRSLAVPDARLGALKRQWRGALRQQHGSNSTNLDGVAKRSASAVQLHHLQLAGHARGARSQGGAQHILLCRPIGCRQRARPAILVHCRTKDNRKRRSVAALALQQHRSAGLPARVAIRSGVQRLAPTVRRKHARAAEHAGGVRRQKQIHTARSSSRALALPQARASQVCTHERRRASRVHAQRRATQGKRVGQPAGCNAQRTAGAHERIGAAYVSAHERHVVQPSHADEHARLCACTAGEATRRQPHLSRALQKQTLLGVHHHRLRVGYAEAMRIKAVHVAHECTEARCTVPKRSTVLVRIPASMRHGQARVLRDHNAAARCKRLSASHADHVDQRSTVTNVPRQRHGRRPRSRR